MRGALAILAKDLRIEWRTRESAASVLVLGLLLVLVFTLAHDPDDAEAARALAPAMLWTAVIFVGLLGVQRSFLLEREQDCLAGLLAAPLEPAEIFLGKLATNVIVLAATQAVVVPLSAIFLHLDLGAVLPGLVLVLGLGNLGFAAIVTLFGAIAVRTRAREVMLPLLVLPLLVPLLIAAVKTTLAVLAGQLADAHLALTVLMAFDVIFTVAGWLLFEYVVRD